MSTKITKKHLEHRLLVEPTDLDGPHGSSMREYFLMEIYPSGKRVKFRKPNGSIFSTTIDEYAVVEDLGEAAK